jgi:hypothetical protein
VLGFEELFREEGADRRACVMRFPGGGYSVGLVEHVGSENQTFGREAARSRSSRLTVTSRDQLDGWAARLTAAGVAHSGPLEIGPGAIMNLRTRTASASHCSGTTS